METRIQHHLLLCQNVKEDMQATESLLVKQGQQDAGYEVGLVMQDRSVSKEKEMYMVVGKLRY